MLLPQLRSSRRGSRARVAAIGAALALGLVATGSSAVLVGPAAAAPTAAPTAAPQAPQATAPDLGPHVVVFDPSMPTAQIQARADAIHAQQVDDEMGSAR